MHYCSLFYSWLLLSWRSCEIFEQYECISKLSHTDPIHFSTILCYMMNNDEIKVVISGGLPVCICWFYFLWFFSLFEQQQFGKKMISTVLPSLSKDCEAHLEKHFQGSQLNSTLHAAMNTHITNLRLLVLPPDELQRQLPPAKPPRSESNVVQNPDHFFFFSFTCVHKVLIAFNPIYNYL